MVEQKAFQLAPRDSLGPELELKTLQARVRARLQALGRAQERLQVPVDEHSVRSAEETELAVVYGEWDSGVV